MFKKLILLSGLLSTLVLSACGGGAITPQAAGATITPAAIATLPVATPVAQVSPTIDPCLPRYARVLAERVHKHMREFDDASTLAVSLNTDKLPGAIAELQRIRRAAQDEPVPSCLGKLKDLQVGHMNMVINTLLATLNGAKSADLQTGIANARKLHDDYTLELASVLGITLTTRSTETPGAAAAGTPAPTSAVTVSNPGPTAVNLRATPDLNGAMLAVFAVNATTPVLGKSPDGKWVQIEISEKPGEKAWLYLQPVNLSGALDAVPVVTP